MNTDKIISLMNDPSLLQGIDLDELTQIINVYPFYATARILRTKKMQQLQHLMLKKEIKKTAVTVPSRTKLYAFLYKKEIQNSILLSQEEETESKEEISEKESHQSSTTNSTFEIPVEIEAQPQPSSSFSKPINLKDFGTDNTSEMDVLEQQIIGQTIELVLSQEIKEQNEVLPTSNPTSSDTHSDTQKFSDWLAILDQERLKSWRSNEEVAPTDDHLNELDIINNFLSKDTNLISATAENVEYTPSNLARLSVVDDEDFVTETLANIYAEQGNLQKALNAYNKLLLKYPEKKTYFAARIKKIEIELK